MTTPHFARVTRGFYSPKGWHPGYLIAFLDGYRVRCVGNGKGWDCTCPDEECGHLNTVAALVAPSVLEELEAESDHRYRPTRSDSHLKPKVRRRRRTP